MNKLIFAVAVAGALVVGSRYPEQTQRYIVVSTVLAKRAVSWSTGAVSHVIEDVQQKTEEK